MRPVRRVFPISDGSAFLKSPAFFLAVTAADSTLRIGRAIAFCNRVVTVTKTRTKQVDDPSGGFS
jgi:hypothetical protein